jgi:hypothetical protein
MKSRFPSEKKPSMLNHWDSSITDLAITPDAALNTYNHCKQCNEKGDGNDKEKTDTAHKACDEMYED